MTLIYVIYGLLALAALSVPYQIMQRARDNAMLREVANSKVNPLKTTTVVASASGAVYQPSEIIQVEHEQVAALKYAHIVPVLKDEDWVRLRNVSGSQHVYISYTHADRVKCYMFYLGDYVLAEPNEKQKSLLTKQAYVVEKGVDSNLEAQSGLSTGRWKRSSTIGGPGLAASVGVFANALAFGTPTMTQDGC